MLKFFLKGTVADTKAYWDRQEDQWAITESTDNYNEANIAKEKKVHERELARLRQQKKRSLARGIEIKEGI